MRIPARAPAARSAGGLDLPMFETRCARAALAVFLLALLFLPLFASTYWLDVLCRIGIAIIGAMGLNLLTGYTGLLSFGHSAFFGIGAYTIAFLLRYLGVHSMELYILIGVPIAAIMSALVGYICVRHTRSSL